VKKFECVHTFLAKLWTRPSLRQKEITVYPGYATVCDHTRQSFGVTRQNININEIHRICTMATAHAGLLVSLDGLTVEVRFMPEELRCRPGISWRCFAAWCVPVVLKNLKPQGPLPGEHGVSQFNVVLAGVATVWPN